MSRKLLVLNAATLSPAAVAAHAPNLRRLASEGAVRALRAPFPGLTCSSHATMLTGELPHKHGIVGNGWYERAHAKLFMWNRSNRLMAGEMLWDAARRRDPSLRCANLFWRLCADSNCETIVTERPVYWSSGRKSFDFYTSPPELHDRLVASLGEFPFQRFWGPLADVQSTRWILRAALDVMASQSPELLLVYAPFLDYQAERHGAESEQSVAALRRFDREVEPLLQAARAEQRDVAVVSDYGWAVAERPVYLNRALRQAGLLNVEVAANGERLEPGTSRAFALCDSQVAHIYVADRADLPAVRALLEAVDGVAEVLDEAGKRDRGVDHPRSGDLIAVARPSCWFAYPYWLDPRAKPDFAHCIAIFDKIGWDPTELFLRPGPLGKLRLAVRLAQKKLRLAVPFDVCGADESQVRGVRSARNDDAERGAVLLTSWALSQQGPVPMESLKEMLLARLFEDGPG
jgi:predicted AlkP superfamily pyrophosphatase or phosphodiesterase